MLNGTELSYLRVIFLGLSMDFLEFQSNTTRVFLIFQFTSKFREILIPFEYDFCLKSILLPKWLNGTELSHRKVNFLGWNMFLWKFNQISPRFSYYFNLHQNSARYQYRFEYNFCLKSIFNRKCSTEPNYLKVEWFFWPDPRFFWMFDQIPPGLFLFFQFTSKFREISIPFWIWFFS